MSNKLSILLFETLESVLPHSAVPNMRATSGDCQRSLQPRLKDLCHPPYSIERGTAVFSLHPPRGGWSFVTISSRTGLGAGWDGPQKSESLYSGASHCLGGLLGNGSLQYGEPNLYRGTNCPFCVEGHISVHGNCCIWSFPACPALLGKGS